MGNKSLPLTDYRLPPSQTWLPQLRKTEDRRRNAFCWQHGQSLIEVIVASAVGILVVTALTFATIFSLRNAQFAKNSAQATKLAQEGIERVRTGRDRNDTVSITGYPSLCTTLASCSSSPTNCNVASWNGDSATSGSIWNYQIYTGCGSGGLCYFVLVGSTGGTLNFIATSASFPTSGTEDVYGNGQFKRAVILADDSNSCKTQKKVTVIVRWTDFAGAHESRLITILGKL